MDPPHVAASPLLGPLRRILGSAVVMITGGAVRFASRVLLTGIPNSDERCYPHPRVPVPTTGPPEI